MSQVGKTAILVLTLLTGHLSLASSLLDIRQTSTNTTIGDGKFKCTYDVFSPGMQVNKGIAYTFGPAASFNDCLTQCDNNRQCSALSWYPHRTDRACIQLDTRYYAQAGLRRAHHAISAQLQPSSCKKPAARVKTLHCVRRPGLEVIFVPKGGQNGCQYRVVCDKAIGTDVARTFARTRSFAKCIAVCDNNTQCYAATYTTSGMCSMGINYQYMNATFYRRGNGVESVQLVEGSCGKQAAMVDG